MNQQRPTQLQLQLQLQPQLQQQQQQQQHHRKRRISSSTTTCTCILFILLLSTTTDALPVPPSRVTPSIKMEQMTLIRPETDRRNMYNLEYPTCALPSKGRAKSFLMVFMGHSGSSAIMSELFNHPEVLIENPEAVDHPPYQFESEKALEFTEQFFQKGINTNRTAGFKIRPWHIINALDKWQALIEKYETRIIWQYRENTLKQSVGEYTLRVLNDTSVLEGLRSKEQVKNRCSHGAGCQFAITDFDLFHSMLKHSLLSDMQILEAASSLNEKRQCLIQVKYEDYLYHRKGTMLDIFEFLGIDQSFESEPGRYKATGDNMCQVVTNWKELCRNFYGCARWRELFEDDINHCSCPFSSSPAKYCDATAAN